MSLKKLKKSVKQREEKEKRELERKQYHCTHEIQEVISVNIGTVRDGQALKIKTESRHKCIECGKIINHNYSRYNHNTDNINKISRLYKSYGRYM